MVAVKPKLTGGSWSFVITCYLVPTVSTLLPKIYSSNKNLSKCLLTGGQDISLRAKVLQLFSISFKISRSPLSLLTKS